MNRIPEEMESFLKEDISDNLTNTYVVKYENGSELILNHSICKIFDDYAVIRTSDNSHIFKINTGLIIKEGDSRIF